MKRLLARLLLLAAGLLAGLLAGEVLLRLFYPQVFPVHPPGMYTVDPEVGYVLTPRFEGRLRRPEFDVSFTTSALGLRGRDPAPRRPETLRVLVLGDSLVWGFGVADDETVAARLEGLLAEAHPGLDPQVLNAGVPGYGTADQLALLRSRGAAYDPDVVVLQFLPVNDFDENRAPSREWATVVDGMLGSSANLEARLDKPWWLRLKAWLKSRSHVVHLVSNSLGYLVMRLGAGERLGIEEGETFTPEDARRAVRLLGEVADTARGIGAECLFVFTTGQARVIAEEGTPLRSLEVVAGAAEEAGVPWLDVTPHLRRRDDRLRLFFPKDGHWTPLGHQAVAEVLAAELEVLGWIPGG